MPDLVCEPSIVPGEESAEQGTIANDGWFPDIDLDALRKEVRVAAAVTAERFRAAVMAAIVTVGIDLAAWAAEQAAAGYATLGLVPAPLLDGESRLLFLYRRALGCYAKAELIERYRDFDTTGAGQKDVDDLGASIGELRRDALHAVRDMKGRGRTTVELI